MAETPQPTPCPACGAPAGAVCKMPGCAALSRPTRGPLYNPIPTDRWLDEHDRMAREAARDAYRAAIAMLDGKGGSRTFGVQHVGGRIKLTVEVLPDGK